jgi:site-specific recombinase XerD
MHALIRRRRRPKHRYQEVGRLQPGRAVRDLCVKRQHERVFGGFSRVLHAIMYGIDSSSAREGLRSRSMERSLSPSSGPLDLVDEVPLGDEEKAYVAAARAANTLKGYRSDWAEWCSWCAQEHLDPLAGDAAAISKYLVFLAGAGAKVGTMARRLSAMRFAFKMRGLADPTGAARVVAVWEGIRRTQGAPPDQAAPLMPPELLDVLDACPTIKTWATPGRPPEPDLAGARDKALLLVGFVGALRRSEIVALDFDHVNDHPNGLVVTIPRSKTNQEGIEPELVVLPFGPNPARCPVRALQSWAELADVSSGPVFRPVSTGNQALARRLAPHAVNYLVAGAIKRAGIDPLPYSAHSLRAGFVTYAHLRGASDRAIAHQTRHRSMATLGQYVRVHEAWQDNAATQLGL